MQVSAAKRYRRTVLLIEGEGVVTLVTRRVPTARDKGLCGGSGVRIRSGKSKATTEVTEFHRGWHRGTSVAFPLCHSVFSVVQGFDFIRTAELPPAVFSPLTTRDKSSPQTKSQ